VKSPLGVIRRALVRIAARRPVTGANHGAVISFTFDDFPRTALKSGGEILKAHGLFGTYYAAMAMMDTVNHLGEQFRREDLDVLLRDGHELASHTYGHVSCSKLSTDQFVEDMRKGQRAIQEVTGECSSNFAYPYGEVTVAGKRMVGQEVWSARGAWGGCNGPEIDLNLLRANKLYGGMEQLMQIQQLILENERRQGWLIFYTHDVQPMPSPYGCDPELLKSVVAFAALHAARILPVKDVVAEFTEAPAQVAHSTV
jgi:peptidoglycan/xylan/chitin deacetylase (PgdA/CDA1 family)